MGTFKTFTPATGAFLEEHTFASAKEVSQSLEHLHNSFLRWQKLSFTERQKILRPAVGLFNQSKEELAKSITLEMGKPYFASLAEIDKAIQACEYMCTHPYNELLPTNVKTFVDTEKTEHVIYHKPRGIILGVMPWNFPFWQAIRMIFPALLTGNTVLLKHSEITPTTGSYLKKILSQVEFKNIFDHLIFDHAMTESIIADPRIGGVSLTGSVKAGYTLSQFAGKYMKRAVLELGGSDAHLVLDDADLAKAARTIVKSRLQNTGQSCIAAKRALIHKSQSAAFLELLKNEFEKSTFGNLFDRKTTVGPLAHLRFKDEDASRFTELNKHGDLFYEKNADADILKSLAVDSQKQAYVPLRIVRFSEVNDQLMKFVKTTEFFSPTLLVFEYDTLEQAINLANATQFGLGGSVYSVDIPRAREVALQFQSGMVAVNEAVQSNVALPFGGVKDSGIGRELGHQGFAEFVDLQVITTNRL